MNMSVAQRRSDGVQTGAREQQWLGELRVVLVNDYGYRPSQVERLDWSKWGVYCASGMSPEEACLAECFSE